MAAERLSTRCCIVGGGPCGLMLGFLLARAGIDVVILEKHADFLRDFRGDTIHPSTLELMGELGLLDDFLKLPHEKATSIGAFFGNQEYAFAERYPTFHLHMRAEAVDLINENGRIVGVRATTPDGAMEVRADLTVACDGRHSTMRERAGLKAQDLGAPMDVLWFRLRKEASDPGESMGRFTAGHIVVLINRGEYWQCAFVIPKGGFEETRRAGLAAFRNEVARLVPIFADRVDELTDWEQIKLLTVAVNRLDQWHRPGLLCIGDAAHAMSPIGGVGINLAVQDAVAAANILWQPLATATLQQDDLARVQERRMFPTRVTQRMQIIIQNNVIGRLLSETEPPLQAPLLLRLTSQCALLRRLPARFVGLGVRPEHVHTPERAAHPTQNLPA